MKLVDILARELDEWPEPWKACAQESNGLVAGFSREDLVHGENNGWEGRVGPGSAYIPLSRDVISKQPIACDQRKAVITRAQWQAAVDALKAETAPAWAGVGLPPVGTVYELKQQVLLAGAYDSKWFDEGDQVEVGGHARFSGAEGSVCTVCAAGQNYTGTIIHEVLRPIRTPEQIEAEEREREVELAIQMINQKPFCPNSIAVQNGIRHAVGEMITAGYRKFEIVDKDDGEGV